MSCVKVKRLFLSLVRSVQRAAGKVTRAGCAVEREGQATLKLSRVGSKSSYGAEGTLFMLVDVERRQVDGKAVVRRRVCRRGAFGPFPRG
ncbi:MAG: hypothetical protein BJ554DRAFT_7858 [Olpidium bornovanus]|uniref:Uncharacterized protein n=1 Tax=Olpidium bornovanus TaxID=278681 RepID=A0A8H8DIY4_9FUNG|nr:MAG: hypothetical protein BJ554DRAFT_7858 [Olpidium bornovanus]